MRDNLAEQVTVDDMARAAMFSKFHFTRIFRRATGVSPGRFLSAMRLQRAKQLLVSTSLNVGDISVLVGYNSVGTFSSRFTRSVGLSPSAYRKTGGFVSDVRVDEKRVADSPRRAVVHGSIWPHQIERHGLVFAGLFPERIPEGRPVRCTVLARPGPYRFDDVPQGDWYLLAHSLPADVEGFTRHTFSDSTALSVGTSGPIVIGRDATSKSVDLQLKPMQVLDPPVLLALLDVRKMALGRRGLPELVETGASTQQALPPQAPSLARRDRSAA
nr:helix-turn-helix transcriptional regulator [Micromonospora pisi]